MFTIEGILTVDEKDKTVRRYCVSMIEYGTVSLEVKEPAIAVDKLEDIITSGSHKMEDLGWWKGNGRYDLSIEEFVNTFNIQPYENFVCWTFFDGGFPVKVEHVRAERLARATAKNLYKKLLRE